jgi:hypothetical protein
MKSFRCLFVLLVGAGGAFLFAPQSRAQSEVAPDHFDGTDSWAAAAVTKVPAPKQKSHLAAVLVAQSTKPATAQFQPVAAREVSAPNHTSARVNKKRKPAAPKSNK